MNLAAYISDYLQENGTVELPDFGVFTSQKISAVLDSENHIIIPPKQQISFVENEKVFSNNLSKYIAEKTGENLFLVQSKMKDEVRKWKDEISLRNNISVLGIGDFIKTDNGVKLISNQGFDVNSNYFGLEEINLKKIKQEENLTEVDNENNYVFNNSILWIFLFIFPVGAMLYLALNYSEKFFGKNSFENISVKTSTHRISTKINAIDSTKVNTTTNIKKDSLKSTK